MLRPNPHLRDLMLRANAEQAELAMGMAKRHVDSCRWFGIEPGPADKVLIEAFEIVLRGDADDASGADVAKNDFYLSRRYGPRYTER
jgi:hypothetical protein